MRISLEMKKGGKRVMEDNKSKLSIDLVTNTENLKKELTGLSTMFHKIADAIDEYTGVNSTNSDTKHIEELVDKEGYIDESQLLKMIEEQGVDIYKDKVIIEIKGELPFSNTYIVEGEILCIGSEFLIIETSMDGPVRIGNKYIKSIKKLNK